MVGDGHQEEEEELLKEVGKQSLEGWQSQEVAMEDQR